MTDKGSQFALKDFLGLNRIPVYFEIYVLAVTLLGWNWRGKSCLVVISTHVPR